MQIDRCDVNLLIFLVVTPYGYRLLFILFILLILKTYQDDNLPSRTIMEVPRNVAFYKLGAWFWEERGPRYVDSMWMKSENTFLWNAENYKRVEEIDTSTIWMYRRSKKGTVPTCYHRQLGLCTLSKIDWKKSWGRQSRFAVRQPPNGRKWRQACLVPVIIIHLHPSLRRKGKKTFGRSARQVSTDVHQDR
jgi:hypothetical protein